MTTQAFHNAAATGKKPNYSKIFGQVTGVKLISVFGRGRYAKIDIGKTELTTLEEKFRDEFIFSENVAAEPFKASRNLQR